VTVVSPLSSRNYNVITPAAAGPHALVGATRPATAPTSAGIRRGSSCIAPSGRQHCVYVRPSGRCNQAGRQRSPQQQQPHDTQAAANKHTRRSSSDDEGVRGNQMGKRRYQYYRCLRPSGVKTSPLDVLLCQHAHLAGRIDHNKHTRRR